jgi:hypothetical protein
MKTKFRLRKTARYFLYTLLATFLFTSCGGSLDEEKCLVSVQEKFPNAEIYSNYEGSNSTYVVIDSVNVYINT